MGWIKRLWQRFFAKVEKPKDVSPWLKAVVVQGNELVLLEFNIIRAYGPSLMGQTTQESGRRLTTLLKRNQCQDTEKFDRLLELMSKGKRWHWEDTGKEVDFKSL